MQIFYPKIFGNSRTHSMLLKVESYALADLGGVPGARPPKGPDSFVLTYKIFET